MQSSGLINCVRIKNKKCIVVLASGNFLEQRFSQPTSPVAWGHVSAIWDPGDPYWSPKTTIFTLKRRAFYLAPFQEGKGQ